MFKASSVCLSALSKRTKRVHVQILKDFPQFQFSKGQIAHVKPSLMTNYLYFGNGARYILKESDVDTVLLKQFEDAQAAKALLAAENSTKPQQKLTKPAAKAKEKTSKVEDGILGRNITLDKVRIPGLDI